MMNTMSDEFKHQLSKIFNPDDDYCFLVGAGVSMNPPSNLPSATEIVKTVIELCTPKEYHEKLLGLKSLRFEALIDDLKNFTRLDKQLVLLDYFDLAAAPNLIHLFIANMVLIGKGRHQAITTNFDYLLEHALIRLVGDAERGKVFPIIRRSDFTDNYNVQSIQAQGRIPICKIHGSKKDLITGEDTAESLVIDLEDLGKDREKGKTFALEPYKRPLVESMIRGRTLVVMGYSGSDDFDITPMLQEFSGIKKIAWFDFSASDKPRIIPLSAESPSFDDSRIACEALLSELCNQKDAESFIIRGSSLDIIRDFVITIFSSEELDGKVPKMQEKPKFREWLEQKQTYRSIQKYEKYYLSGSLLQSLGELDDALSCYKHGKSLVPTSNEQYLSSFLNNIGLIYDARGEYDSALEYYTQALDILEKLGDLKKKASVLNNIGLIYDYRGEYDSALEYYTQALDIDEKLENLNGKATRLNNVGLIYKNRGEYDSALEYYTQALDIDEKLGNLNGKATRLNNIGLIYYNRGEYDSALEYYTQALDIDEKLGDLKGKATDLNNIGSIYDERGEYDKALEYYTKALDILEKLGDLKRKASVLNNIGSIYDDRGEYDSALEYYTQALDIDEKLENLKGKATRLNNIGSIYDDRGEYDKALEYYTQALDIFEKLGDLKGKASVLNNIGLIYDYRGEYDKALEYYTQALEINETLGDLNGKATRLNNIGSIYDARGEHDKALEYYTEALDILEKLGDLKRKASVLNSIGLIYNNRGEYDSALEYYTQALDILEKLGDLKKKASVLNNIGLIYDYRGEYDSALEYYTQALDIDEKLGNLKGKANRLNNIAVLYYNGFKDVKNALRYMTLCLNVYEKLNLAHKINKTQKNIDFLKGKL